MATVQVQCPDCTRSYSIDRRALGRRARCKHCGCDFPLTPSVDESVAAHSSTEAASAFYVAGRTLA
jgi:transposase-like protein